MKSWRCIRPDEAERLVQYIMGLPLPFRVSISEGDKRSLDQNALLHKWFGEIAKHFGDRDMVQVKGECHHKYGLPIKRRDAVWGWVWDKAGDPLPYEKQCKLLASGTLNVSSGMSSPELSEYMDAMARDYRAQGVRLTDPEERKAA